MKTYTFDDAMKDVEESFGVEKGEDTIMMVRVKVDDGYEVKYGDVGTLLDFVRRRKNEV